MRPESLRRICLSAMVAVAALAGATACSGDEAAQTTAGGTEAGPEPAIDATLEVSNIKTFALPLDTYEFTTAKQQEFDKGRLLLVQRCMERFGFDYPLPPSVPSILGENEKRFSLADPKRAATVGYHDPEEDDRSRKIGSAQEMTSEMEAVLNGLGAPKVGGVEVPKGGCNGEALTKLGGGPGADEDFGHSLAQKSYSQALADSRVVKANADWSACMKAAGHDYADPLEANDDPKFATDTATEAEIAVATADVECKIKANYINVRAAVETAYQKREIERNKAALDAAKAKNEEVMRQVSKVISGQL